MRTSDNVTPPSHFRRWHIPAVLVFFVGTVFILMGHQPHEPVFQTYEGAIFGTFFHVKYEYPSSLDAEILSKLQKVDASLSMFNPQSTISRINRGESTATDSLLREVWQLSQQVSAATDGAFDPTCAPLVNAWGFGYKNGQLPNDAEVDSILSLVGWQKVRIEDEQMIKDDDRMVLDFSAVAKGYGVDQVADYLMAKGVENFMVEIGGEVVVRGHNPKGEAWHIGLAKPVEDTTATHNELQRTFEMNDMAIATSGNYRNFHVVGGRKIAHTIDPRTGYPVQHSLLSSSVWAPTCAMADAYATAFMVVGVERAKEILAQQPQLRAYFIYTDHNGNYQTYESE